MITAINELEKAKNILDKAILLAKENTIDSLLQYYKIGNDDYGHLPTHTTKYEKGILKRLIDLLNAEIKDTNFVIKSKNYLPDDVYIYLNKNKNGNIKNSPFIKELMDEEFKVGTINLLKGTVTHSENIANKYSNAITSIQFHENQMKQLENFIKESEAIINKKRNKFQNWRVQNSIKEKEENVVKAKARLLQLQKEFDKKTQYYIETIDMINNLVKQIHELYNVTDKWFKCENKINIHFEYLKFYEGVSEDGESKKIGEDNSIYLDKSNLIVTTCVQKPQEVERLKPYVIPNERIAELLLCSNTQKVEVENIEFQHTINKDMYLHEYYQSQINSYLRDKLYTKLGFYLNFMEKEGFIVSRLKLKHNDIIYEIQPDSHITIYSAKTFQLKDIINKGLLEILFWRKK